MSEASDFQRPWWMFSTHLETTAAIFNKTPAITHTRDIVKTSDGDEIALEHTAGGQDKPLVVMFHGLEGDSNGRGLRLLATRFSSAGWNVAVPHFRGCGGHPNVLPRAYHAADNGDVEWMLNYCCHAFPHHHLFAVGVSLGGAALMRFLTQKSNTELKAAAVVCAPFKVEYSIAALSQPLNRLLYGRYFLKSLRQKIIVKSKKYPFVADMKKLRAAKTISDFDHLYTAPIHGFKDAHDYWRQASSFWTLGDIKSPLLCINTLNDPLVPFHSLPPPQRYPHIVFNRPKHGGHGGFFGKPPNWLANNVFDFFNTHLQKGS